MDKKNIIILIILIIICQLSGLIGTLFTGDFNWYNSINKPFFTPPNWLFGPAWITLYTLIAISIWTIYISPKIKSENKILLYKIFAIQLILNALWTPAFFGMQNIFLALVIILLLLSTIIYLGYLFKKTNKISFYLFLPYILWVSFATLLNLSILILN